MTGIKAPSTLIRIFLNPQPFLSGYGFRPHASGEFGNESDNGWTVNTDIFESDDVAKLCPVSYRTINQYGGTTCRPSFSGVNPDTIGCVWTDEFDLNKSRVDGEIFESGEKELRIQKYPDTCGGDLRVQFCVWLRFSIADKLAALCNMP